MRFVKFQTLTFVPIRDHFKRRPTFSIDAPDEKVFQNTYVNADQIMVVYATNHSEITVQDYNKRTLHTVPANTTAIRMVDGTIYYVELPLDAVVVKIEKTTSLEWQDV